jgi:chromosome segregation ATPase
MPDSLERRVGHLEQKVVSILDALDIRFGRVDRELAELREQIAEMQERLTEIDQRLPEIERKLDLALSELRALPAVLARIIKGNGET